MIMAGVAERLPPEMLLACPSSCGEATQEREDVMTSISRRQIAAAGMALPLLIPQIARAQEPTPTPPGAGIGSGGEQPGTGSGTPVPQSPTSFTPMDPVLGAVTTGPKQVELVAQETTVYVAKDVAYAGWSFGGT